jgi:hypothetical protein
MKKASFVMIFRWVLPLSFVLIFVFLPNFTFTTSIQRNPLSSIYSRVFFAIFLSIPFFSTAEILSKISETQIQNYEIYFIKGQKGFTLQGIILGGGIVFMSLLGMFFALQNFPSISILIRWMISVVYSVFVLRLNWRVEDYLKI